MEPYPEIELETPAPTEYERLPPHSIDAEMSLLGSFMIDPQSIDAAPEISAYDFYQQDNAIIFSAILRLKRSAKAIDAITVRQELLDSGRLEEVGGSTYIGRLLNTVPSAAHAAHYASIVLEASALRSLISVYSDAIRRAYEQGPSKATSSEIAVESTGKITALMERGLSRQVEKWSDVVMSAYEEAADGGAEMIQLGLAELDRREGGIAAGEMLVLAARPSMGKSTLVRQIAASLADRNISVGFISLEEGSGKIGRNALSAASGVDNYRIRSPKLLAENDWNELAAALTRIVDRPIVISTHARTPDAIRAVATVMRSRYGVKVLILDHLGKVRAPGRSLYESVTNASSFAVDLFKDLGVAGIVVHQLNRAVESRDDKRPNLSDLRESGQLEQDADAVVFLHREDYYGVKDQNYQPDGIAELIVAKWRDGIRGETFKLRSDLKHQRFLELGEQF